MTMTMTMNLFVAIIHTSDVWHTATGWAQSVKLCKEPSWSGVTIYKLIPIISY